MRIAGICPARAAAYAEFRPIPNAIAASSMVTVSFFNAPSW